MSNLDNCCITDYWSCCESSISTNKFYAFSAETEEHFEKIEQEIADIEASGLTYEAGDYIKIEGNVISVSGLQDDIATLSGKVETITGDVITINNDITAISATIDSISAVTEQDLEEALATKQDKLTATNFIDITNNVISAKISVLSRAQWEALVDRDPTILYLIRQD